jgi:hypothetical protein
VPSRQVLIGFGIGLAVIAAMIGGFLYATRGAHVVLEGTIQKVRTQAMDEKSCVAFADFRFVNPSDHPFVVRSVTMTIEDKDGKRHEGTFVADVDAKQIFDYYKTLGPKYNDSLLPRERIPSRESRDRMSAARFEVPESVVQSRRSLVVRVEEVDGGISEIAEQR